MQELVAEKRMIIYFTIVFLFLVMTLYQYKFLDAEQQAAELWLNGIFINDGSESIHNIALYALHDFYVEVWYQAMSDQITRMISYISKESLDPFLETIDISDLLL